MCRSGVSDPISSVRYSCECCADDVCDAKRGEDGTVSGSACTTIGGARTDNSASSGRNRRVINVFRDGATVASNSSRGYGSIATNSTNSAPFCEIAVSSISMTASRSAGLPEAVSVGERKCFFLCLRLVIAITTYEREDNPGGTILQCEKSSMTPSIQTTTTRTVCIINVRLRESCRLQRRDRNTQSIYKTPMKIR